MIKQKIKLNQTHSDFFVYCENHKKKKKKIGKHKVLLKYFYLFNAIDTKFYRIKKKDYSTLNG